MIALLIRFFACTFCAVVACHSPAAAADANVTSCRCSFRSYGDWVIAESANFTIWTRERRQEAGELAARCEQLRTALTARWFDEPVEPSWRPKCLVVVHADAVAYARGIGKLSDRSVGCTTISRDEGRILYRRIDLRSDAADWTDNALPHELTHVVLADAFPDRQPPGWLNEGMAMTSEGSELRTRRMKILADARRRGALPRLEPLLMDARMRSAMDADLHYAASLSLVECLLQRGDAAQLIELARQTAEGGSVAGALERSFNIPGGTRSLERLWHRHLAQGRG